MLTHIHIWNLAVVEKLDIEITTGLSTITGETGAGKSILLDALGLALGDRADSHIVRHGEDKAEVSVTFSTHDAPAAEKWLVKHEMDSENECIIRRSISAAGTSKAFINGIPAPVKLLRELGELLVDLHGQHEHQSLLKKELQRQLLDDYAGNQSLLTDVKTHYRSWHTLQNEYAQLSQASAERSAQLELLRYQVNELETLAFNENEANEVEQEHRKLANASHLIRSLEMIIGLLDEADGFNVNTELNKCISEVGQLCNLDASLESVAELLNQSLINAQEAVSELKHYQDDLDIDPERLEWLEQRLADMQQISRKHQCSLDEIHTLLPVLSEKLDKIENADVRIGSLQGEIKKAQESFLAAATALSTQRKKSAAKLSRLVTESMQTLGMDGGSFEIAVTTDKTHFTSNGFDEIEFLVSANKGQERRALAKVASGGELSRISLAIQVITAKDTRIPTLVFDEVDVGIGGRIAEIVGRLLRRLAEHNQVLCVTHLPQVAALGHQHMQVNKTSDKKSTYTSITSLDKQQRIDELARMLGGLEITEQTRSHAKEMIERAEA